MTRPVILPEAEQDLTEIWTHIAEDSLDAADRVLGWLSRTLVRIADFPEIGHQRSDLTALPVRFFTARGFTVIYRSDVRPVEILRVAGRGRDLRRMLD